MSEDIRASFRRQASMCLAAGSAFTSDILLALADTLDRSTRTGAHVLDWRGDPIVDALPLRLTGGLHALARSGRDRELSRFYQARAGESAAVLKRVLADWDDWLLPWLDGPPQTNEVARAGALWPGVMEVARRFGPRVELIELGPSAGLNLNMDRFGYRLGGASAGDASSPVQLKPDWEGPPPATAVVDVVARAGIDRSPLDVAVDAVAERLIAYVWPDQAERLARAEAAISIARAFPPPLEKGDAAEWLEARLATPQEEGVTRIVFHSIVLQYLPPEGRARVRAALEQAGAHAAAGRALAWLSMEFYAQAPMAELRLTCWPGGETELLGRVHPHGAKLIWGSGESS